MQDGPSSGLISPDFAGRLRYQRRSSVYARRSVDGIMPVGGAAPISRTLELPEPGASLAVTVPVKLQIARPVMAPGVPKQAMPSSFDVITHRPRQQFAQGQQYMQWSADACVPQEELPDQAFRQSVLENLEPTMCAPARQRRRQGRIRLAKPHFSLNSSNLMTAMACLIFIGGAVVSINGAIINHRVKQQVATITHAAPATVENSVGSTDNVNAAVAPSEAPVPTHAVSSYRVPADEPKLIKIPKLGVNARVGKVGLTKDGELATPYNIYDTAWYKNSAKPGVDAGAVLIDGHVSGPTAHGVFYGIKNLKAGDKIQIVRGDNQLITYQVVSTTEYDRTKVDTVTLLSSVQPGKQGLNLITCGGQYNEDIHQFNQRTVVFAVQI